MQVGHTPNGEFAPFSFAFSIDLGKSGPAKDNTGDWVVAGPLSNPSKDLEGQVMDMGGLRKGLQTFEALGKHVDWEHLYERTRRPSYLIGKGVRIYDAPHPKTGEDVPWLETRLFKNKPLAQEAVQHLQAGENLAYSVAGGVLLQKGNRILQPVITTVGLTPMPVVSENTGTVQFCKALNSYAGGRVSDLDLPNVPEVLLDLWHPISKAMTCYSLTGDLPGSGLWKALAASGDLSHEGPGADALAIADHGGKKRRIRDLVAQREEETGEAREITKALAFLLRDAFTLDLAIL